MATCVSSTSLQVAISSNGQGKAGQGEMKVSLPQHPNQGKPAMISVFLFLSDKELLCRIDKTILKTVTRYTLAQFKGDIFASVVQDLLWSWLLKK